MAKQYLATLDGTEHEVEIEEVSGHNYLVSLGERKFEVDLRQVGGSSFSIFVDSRSFDFEVSRDGEEMVVASRGGLSRVTLVDKSRRALVSSARRVQSGRIEIKAMMPGRVISVLVKPGDDVTADQGVLIVEAMKMENELKSPKAGKVLEVKVEAGQTVEKGALLVVIE